MADDLVELILADAAGWRSWLKEGHGRTAGVWLVLAKKGTVSPTSLRYDDALDEALCYGWIDGQARSRDATTYYQRFTPRRSRSSWSARNVAIVARLVAEDRCGRRAWRRSIGLAAKLLVRSPKPGSGVRGRSRSRWSPASA